MINPNRHFVCCCDEEPPTPYGNGNEDIRKSGKENGKRNRFVFDCAASFHRIDLPGLNSSRLEDKSAPLFHSISISAAASSKDNYLLA
jgi:hypothetical protein